MIFNDRLNDVVASAAKAAPPVSVSGGLLLGLDLSQWLIVATLVYTLLQIVFLIRDKVFGMKDDK